jgi:hypothetical protein
MNAPFQTSNQPNVADLTTFLRDVVKVPVDALPDGSQYIAWALSYAQELTVHALRRVGSDYYVFAVYSLATSFLLNWCPDQPDQTFFADQQRQLGLTTFVGGVVQSTADQATSDSLLSPEFLSGLTIQQLQALKDPYGRQWLAMQQDMGNVWGIS